MGSASLATTQADGARASHLVPTAPSMSWATVSFGGLLLLAVASTTFSAFGRLAAGRVPIRPVNHSEPGCARAASCTPTKPPPPLMYAWNAASCASFSVTPLAERKTTLR